MSDLFDIKARESERKTAALLREAENIRIDRLERAAIMEYDGGLTRAEADRRVGLT